MAKGTNAIPVQVTPVPTSVVSMKRLCLILAAFAFMVYVNTLNNGYALDDAAMITDNAMVSKGISAIPQILNSSRMAGAGVSQADAYRPLSLIMFAAEHDIFGGKPAAGHLINVLLFAGCVVALFIFLSKMLGQSRAPVAFIAALLFLLHPLHTEVVANIKSRDELLCFFFAFLSLKAFMRYKEKGTIASLAGGLASLFLAFLAKETVVAFIVVIPMLFFFLTGSGRKRAAVISLTTIVVFGAYMALRAHALGGAQLGAGKVAFIDNAMVNLTTAGRMATGFYVLGKYLLLLLVPFPLSCDYCYNSIPAVAFSNPLVLASVALHLGLTAYAVLLLVRRRQQSLAFSILFYLLTIVLFSNIPFLIGAEMGERFVFFASVGFCLAAALAVERWLFSADSAGFKNILSGKVLAVLVPLSLVYAGISIARNADWKDNYTLFRADVVKLPQNAKLHYFLGNDIVKNEMADVQDKQTQSQLISEAKDHLYKAIAIYPAYADAYTTLGNLFFAQHITDSASAYYQQAMAMDRQQYVAANNLAVIAMRVGRFSEAVQYYQSSIAVIPTNAHAWYDMGGCLIQLQQYDSAIAALKQAASLDPQLTDANMLLGQAYFLQKHYDDAIACINKVLQQQPGNVSAMGNLGTICLEAGRPQQALELFKKVLAAEPKSAAAYSNLGHCYFRMKDYRNAAVSLAKAIQMGSKNGKDVPAMALSCKALGDMPHALELEGMARKQDPSFSLAADPDKY